MEGSEVAVLVGSVAVCLLTWTSWYWPLLRIAPGRSTSGRIALVVCPPACGTLLFLILNTLAADDVRTAPVYLLFYMVVGAAWAGLTTRGIIWLGVSPRDDAIERHNPAAVSAIIGALIALTLCFAGGNIGNGPGWWVVLYCASLSTGTLALLWLGVEAGTHVSETVTIERDPQAGVRLGAWLVAIGLIVGRAVAGDWVSAERTVQDYVQFAWPTVLFVLAEVVIERRLRPAPDRPAATFGAHGFVPALLYLGAAGLYVVSRGWAR